MSKKTKAEEYVDACRTKKQCPTFRSQEEGTIVVVTETGGLLVRGYVPAVEVKELISWLRDTFE